jgi:RNA polymerase sigma factor (sigma-70 family)
MTLASVATLDRAAEQRQIANILEELGSGFRQQAWADFLECYSPLILQVVRLFEGDPDDIADCFLFVCQQLAGNGFRRLRRFRPDGPASFATWMRAVSRRLCLDWYRSAFGRARIFDSIARLSALDREVFRLVYEQSLPLDEAMAALRIRFGEVTAEQVGESLERIQQSLTPRQHWLLSTRKRRLEPLEAELGERARPGLDRLHDPGPDPEALAVREEERAGVAQALASLPASERLIVRLRFEEELTLEQVARLTGLGDAQAADRRIRKILNLLRQRLGKITTTSV